MVNIYNLFKISSIVSIISTGLVSINNNLKEPSISKNKKIYIITKTSTICIFLIIAILLLGDFFDDSLNKDMTNELFESTAIRV